MTRRAIRPAKWTFGRLVLIGLFFTVPGCPSLAGESNHPAQGGSTVVKTESDAPEGSPSALEVAEAFIDAFYSWNAAALTQLMDAGEAGARALYYQAWAEAGHYVVENRQRCRNLDDGRVECAITVHDDIGQTLGYVATDVFRLSIEGDRVVGVDFDSDDPPIFDELFAWIAKDRPEVLAGPCRDLFAGGDTPAACVRAVVQAARDFSRLAPNER